MTSRAALWSSGCAFATWAKASSPTPSCFPEWNDSELQGDIKNQPVLFFREIFANDLSILDLLDSKWTIATRKLQKVLYNTNVKPARPNNQEQPQRIELPEGSHRGGLLGMSAVLAISSHPQRTSPVLRGKWLLEAILGTPPPPPPPNVPEARGSEGRRTPRHACASAWRSTAPTPPARRCHSRIDPLGFALENYDVLGRWRTEDAGKPIDATGRIAGRNELRRSRSAQGRSDAEEGLCSSATSRTRCSDLRSGAG